MAVPPALSRRAPVALPHLVTDPVWSLRPWPVVVSFFGEDVVIPALPAADWLQALMPERANLYDMFPGLLDDEGGEWVDECLFEEKVSQEELEQLHLDILSSVTGRPWYISLRLISIARTSWDTLGAELVTLADADRLSIAGWLDVLYLHILRNVEDTKIQMFVSQLELPPVGYATEDPQDLEMSPSAFMALGQ